MRIDILSLFPKMFEGPFGESIVKRAVDRGLVSIAVHNPREYTHDRHHTVDDYPYGGGDGMVMKPEPIFETVESIRPLIGEEAVPVILLTPQGRLFCQEVAQELSRDRTLVLV